jgi:hypothetical protein
MAISVTGRFGERKTKNNPDAVFVSNYRVKKLANLAII